MIRATITPQGLTVTATLRLRNLPPSSAIEFLVDTGSPATALHPDDAERLNITSDISRDATQTTLVGIGGPAAYLEIPATIEFAGTNDYGQAVAYTYPISLHIADPTEHNANFPAILGFDVIQYWQSVQTQDPATAIIIPKPNG